MTKLKSGPTGDPAWFMRGNGGNNQLAVPGLDRTGVLTSTSYATKGMPAQTDPLLADHMLPAVEN